MITIIHSNAHRARYIAVEFQLYKTRQALGNYKHARCQIFLHEFLLERECSSSRLVSRLFDNWAYEFKNALVVTS